MVDIAQLVSASDCGSEGRGFESHYPPQKQKPRLFALVFCFLGLSGDNGIRKAVKKTCRWHIFCRKKHANESHYPPRKQGHPFGCPLFLSDDGIRKAVKKTCRWHVFRPWENPWKADGIPQGLLAVFHLSVHWAVHCINL